MGTVPRSSLTASTQIPASSGLPGPGESTILSAPIDASSSTVTRSFLTTVTSGSMEPMAWYRLYEKLS